MTKKKSSTNEEHQTHYSGSEALETAQATQAGADFEWHLGRVTRMGNFEIAGGRQVSIIWEEGGVSSQQGEIADEQWEIFKLAFLSTGRIAVLQQFEIKQATKR